MLTLVGISFEVGKPRNKGIQPTKLIQYQSRYLTELI